MVGRMKKMKRIRFSTLYNVLEGLDDEVETRTEGISRCSNRSISAVNRLLGSLRIRGIVEKVDKKEWLKENKSRNPASFTHRKGNFFFLTDKGVELKRGVRSIVNELEEWLV